MEVDEKLLVSSNEDDDEDEGLIGFGDEVV